MHVYLSIYLSIYIYIYICFFIDMCVSQFIFGLDMHGHLSLDIHVWVSGLLCPAKGIYFSFHKGCYVCYVDTLNRFALRNDLS